MITVLSGENSFENERALRVLVSSFAGEIERVDGADVTAGQLPELLMGATLFAPSRLVVVRGLSENKTAWTDLADWVARSHDDVHLVLVEPKLDKRTKTYKALQKHAVVKESAAWTDRDRTKAEMWAAEEAKGLGLALDKKSAHLLVERIGVDQWQLYRALEKLAALGTATVQDIERYIEVNPSENVFMLFESALKGDGKKVSDMIATLEVTEDAYRLFGLLSGQALQLAALSVANRPSAEVAKDFGVHPFALSKLEPYARRLGQGSVRDIAKAFIQADEDMKLSVAEPWLLIERALQKTAAVAQK